MTLELSTYLTYLTISILPRYLVVAALQTLVCYYWAFCVVLFWFRRPLDSQWLAEYYPIHQKRGCDSLCFNSTFWVDIIPHIAKFIFFPRHMFRVMRIHISSLKLHTSLSQAQEALGSALEHVLKFWKCQGTSFLSMFIWTEISICRVVTQLEQCRKRACKEEAMWLGLAYCEESTPCVVAGHLNNTVTNGLV